ncbi:MAG: MMPL family transporter [Acidobacteriota bacterium]
MITPADQEAFAAAVGEGDLLEAADALAERLEGSREISTLRTGLEVEEEDFFRRFVIRRAPLLLDDGELADLEALLQPAALERRAAELRAQLRAPTGSLQAVFARDDPLGLAFRLPLVGGGGALPIDPVTGAFQSRRGDAALLIATPAGGELDPDSGRRLLADLDAAFAAVEAEFPGVRCRAVGGPLYAAQDETAIRADMESTVAGSVIGVTAILLLAFGGLWVPTAAVLVLAASFVVTAAALAVGLGQLTAVGLGFAAVLVGLGVDYAIHGATRFRQALLDGADAPSALAQAVADAGPGIATSALTTAAAFATLGAAHFRPLRELGLVVATGIVAIVLMTAWLGAALLVARPQLRPPGSLWSALDRLARGTVSVGERYRTAVLALAAVATAGALLAVPSLRLEPDISALRPHNHPVFETERLLVERFGLGTDTATVVVQGEDLQTTLHRVRAVTDVLERRLDGVQVTSAADWLSAAPAARLERLAQAGLGPAAERLEAALRASNLSPAAFRGGLDALAVMGAGEDPGAPGPADWPPALRELLRETPDGYAAAVRLRLPDGTWPAGPPPSALEEIRRAAPGALVASAPRLGAAMKRVADQDLGRLSLLGLGLVMAVVGLSFRGDLGASALALVPVTLGTLWTLGFWAASGRPLDLLSLSVVPILLGIGIDDGLHAVHGTRGVVGGFEARRLAASVGDAGLAMALTTVTTCVGFGSLAFSSIPGLARGGLLVPIGVVSCLAATFLVLPALGSYGRKDP